MQKELKSVKLYDIIFSLGRSNGVLLTKDELIYHKHLLNRKIAYINITGKAKVKGRIITKTLVVPTIDGPIEVKGVRNNKALLHFCLHLNKKTFTAKIATLEKFCQRVEAAIHDFYSFNKNQVRYYKFSTAQTWIAKHKKLFEKLKSFKKDDFYNQLSTQAKSRVTWLYGMLDDIEPFRKEANKDFITYVEYHFKDYFDKVESRPLTPRQRRACIVDEDHNLVLAGAGSGKTSVIVAKAGFVEMMKWARSDEILVLAYGRKASDETQERIGNRLGENSSIKSSTFHALGLKIIGQVEGKKPSIFTPLDSKKGLLEYVHKRVEAHSKQDEQYRDNLLQYFSDYLYPLEDIFNFETVGEYYEHMAQQEPKTFDGNKVKSQEELWIGNFLYLSGVKYSYEQQYLVDLATADRRQYKPDFYLKERLYLEHYGINQKGETPSFMNKQQSAAYKQSIMWKRAVHSSNQTGLIETYSAELRNTDWKKMLKALLSDIGIELKAIDPKKALESINEMQTYSNRLDQLIATFLELQKMKGVSPEELIELSKADPKTNQWLKSCGLSEYSTKRFNAFLRIYLPVFKDYQEEIAQEEAIDFNDMVNKAVAYIQSKQFTSPWKYILVDEFQDISTGRAKLVKSLIRSRPDTTLFCVGDDWQSIYRFAGANSQYVRHFEDKFGASERTDLDMTFRSNSSISNVAGRFISKNPQQLKKQITAYDQTDEQRVTLLMYDEAKADAALLYCLSEISGNAGVGSKKTRVFLLGRFKHKKPDNLSSIRKKFPQLEIEFHTMHASKGAEADHVILLGIEGGRFGFPGEIEADTIVELMLPQDENFKDAEERRLFYVALTRARHKAYILCNSSLPSRFTRELLLEQKRFKINAIDVEGNRLPQSELLSCKQCKTGAMIQKTNSKNNSTFFSCSNFPHCNTTLQCCPKCSEGCLELKHKQWRCSKCAYTESLCPKCDNGRLILKDGQFGSFWGCTNYSKRYKAISCSFTKQAASVKIRKPEDTGTQDVSENRPKIQTNKKNIKSLKNTAKQTLKLYESGLSIEQIAKKRKLVTSTINGHIEEIIQHGFIKNIDSFVDRDTASQIVKAYNNLGKPTALRQVFEALHEEYSYNIIRFVVALELSKNSS